MLLLILNVILIPLSNSVMILNNVNLLVLIIIFVVGSIYQFKMYYIFRDVRYLKFILIFQIFTLLMIIMLSSQYLVMFVRWEGIGLISFLLIGYWKRPERLSRSVSAIMYNRLGDICFLLLYLIVGGENLILCTLIAIFCKSSLYLWSYWLPVAMERPTPVSSLLHSSTIVVAGVWLRILYSEVLMLLIIVFILTLSILNHYDLKKNVAYSTSLHLTLILLMVRIQLYGGVVVYILLHRIVKRQIFQSSGFLIHITGNQDLRVMSPHMILLFIMLGILLLTAGCRMVMGGSKEQIVVDLGMVFILLIVVLTYVYTKSFLHKNGTELSFGEIGRIYVFLIVLSSISLMMLMGEWNLMLLILSVIILVGVKKIFQVLL